MIDADNILCAGKRWQKRGQRTLAFESNVAAHDGLAPTLRALVMVSTNTYRTIVYVCADTPESSERKLEYGLSATPLARTLLDALFAVVYLFDDPIARAEEFYKGGWREMFEANARYHAAYGHDPYWAAFSADHDKRLAEIETLVGITAAERAKPSTVPHIGSDWNSPPEAGLPAYSHQTGSSISRTVMSSFSISSNALRRQGFVL